MGIERFDIEIFMAMRSHCGADWRWENQPDVVEYLNLYYVLDGKGLLTLGDTVYAMQAGDCFVVRMWEPILGLPDPVHPPTTLWALYRYPGQAGQADESTLPPRYRRLPNPAFFAELFEHVITAASCGGEQRACAAHWMTAVLMTLEEQDRQLHLQGDQREQYEQMRQLCARIQRDPAQPMTIAALADACGYSVGHFTRLFHRCIGMSPRDFITKTRMEMAKSMLYLSGENIGRIAEQVGYNDIYHFSHRFREWTGMTPSDFRSHHPTSAPMRTPRE
jgi:AraC-like DNA-binding protein